MGSLDRAEISSSVPDTKNEDLVSSDFVDDSIGGLDQLTVRRGGEFRDSSTEAGMLDQAFDAILDSLRQAPRRFRAPFPGDVLPKLSQVFERRPGPAQRGQGQSPNESRIARASSWECRSPRRAASAPSSTARTNAARSVSVSYSSTSRRTATPRPRRVRRTGRREWRAWSMISEAFDFNSLIGRISSVSLGAAMGCRLGSMTISI